MSIAKQKAELKKMMEFDESTAKAHVQTIWPVDDDDHYYEWDQKMNWRTGFVNGARWQHAQFAKIAEQYIEALEVIEFYAAKDVSFEGGMEIKDEYDGEIGDRARAFLVKVSKENGK